MRMKGGRKTVRRNVKECAGSGSFLSFLINTLSSVVILSMNGLLKTVVVLFATGVPRRIASGLRDLFVSIAWAS